MCVPADDAYMRTDADRCIHRTLVHILPQIPTIDRQSIIIQISNSILSQHSISLSPYCSTAPPFYRPTILPLSHFSASLSLQ